MHLATRHPVNQQRPAVRQAGGGRHPVHPNRKAADVGIRDGMSHFPKAAGSIATRNRPDGPRGRHDPSDLQCLSAGMPGPHAARARSRPEPPSPKKDPGRRKNFKFSSFSLDAPPGRTQVRRVNAHPREVSRRGASAPDMRPTAHHLQILPAGEQNCSTRNK